MLHILVKKVVHILKMDSQKIENLLNLAINATPEEREKSPDLNVGYDRETKSWEVVIKFFGTTEQLQEILQTAFPDEFERIKIRNLSNEYAILELPEHLVEAVASLPAIEYMEKPKSLYFAVNQGKSASCINPLQTGTSPVSGENYLTGRGTLVAIVDSGIDYSHPDFRNPDGTTRILRLWDQTLEIVYDEATINQALEQPTERLRNEICPSRDVSGHGTHVAGIAAGNGRASGGRYRGVAFDSKLIIVKLGTPRENSFPRTTELMSAIDFCILQGREFQMPVAVNLSFGNNYGSHSGTSLIETFINDMANYGQNVIVIGSGNDGASAVHTAGQVHTDQIHEVELVISDYETSFNLQIWKNYADDMEIALISPDGTRIGPLQQVLGPQRFRVGNTNLLVYYGEPSPYNPYQEIYFDFIPEETYLDAGIWRIQLIPQQIVNGNFDMWLPAGGVLNTGTGFLYPVEETTLTIPSTAAKTITVGAYDARFNQPAAFSGRGYTRETNQVKPDLVAPGVEITSCAPGGGYTVRTGTSMATPFVTGSAALMMQWGIIDGNDRYLYGEKIKAYLTRGARRTMGGFSQWPNPQLGWGTLCVKESLPR